MQSVKASWKIMVVFAILMGCFWNVSNAQSTYSSQDFWSRVRYGGGVSLGFGNDAVQIGLTPSAIYQVNNYLALGLGLNYTYSKIGDTKWNAFGGSVLALANPIPALQVSAEYEQLYVNRDFGFVSDSYWLPALFLGLGFNTGPVTFGIRYDVLYDDGRSLYGNPWLPFVRFYF